MSKRLPWFRMYVDFLNDPKLIALAFEDQRHFIGLLALKSDGVLDEDVPSELLDRIVAQRLWIDHAVIREVKKRLITARLIDQDWQPLAWEKRQFDSDADPTNAARQRRYRERKKAQQPTQRQGEDAAIHEAEAHPELGTKARNVTRNVTVTGLDTDTDTDTDTEVEVEVDGEVDAKTKTTPSLRSGVERASRPESAVPLASQTEPPDCTVPAPDPPPARKRPRSSASPPPCPEDVDAQLWADWLTVRRAKRAPLTATALAGVQREANKAAITLAEALRCCVESGWVGFKAEWFARLNAPAAPPHHGHAPPAESFRERDQRRAKERFARLAGLPIANTSTPPDYIDVESAAAPLVRSLPSAPLALATADTNSPDNRRTPT